jgi:hypothetical protein
MLRAVSLAWDHDGGASHGDAVVDRCVRPARDALSSFPSVTVLIEPEHATRYELRWNGVVPAASLPSLVPGRHSIDLAPPEGHGTSLTIDGRTVRRRWTGPLHHDIELRWAQRMRILIQFEPLAPASEQGMALAHDTRPARADDGSQVWLWGGTAALVLGVGGFTLSALRAASLERRSLKLFEEEAPANEIRALWSAADDWRYWGYSLSGVAASAGVASLAAYLLLDSASEARTRNGARSAIQLGKRHVGVAVSGTF